jgi:hypothetical protein
MLAGPPLLAAAAIPGLAGEAGLRAGAVSLDPPRPLAACAPEEPAPPRAGAAPGDIRPAGRPAAPGTWWRTDPSIDAAGSLDGWVLQAGAPGASTTELRVPAESTVTGPTGGRVVVASEPAAAEDASIVRIVDPAAGCATELRIEGGIARRAIVDPNGHGALVHLLEPGTRRDLGVWRIGADGQIAERLVEPLPDALREAAGMDRAWVTDLRLDAQGGRLAVQSCHPDGCVTRVLDLATGDVAVLDREGQGPIVGFAGRELISWVACHGLPCPVVAWDAAGEFARTLAPEAAGAALSGDGRLLAVLVPRPDDQLQLLAIDVRSGAARSLGASGRDDVLLSGVAGSIAGLETAGATVAIGHAGIVPTPRALDDTAPSFVLPDFEVQP